VPVCSDSIRNYEWSTRGRTWCGRPTESTMRPSVSVLSVIGRKTGGQQSTDADDREKGRWVKMRPICVSQTDRAPLLESINCAAVAAIHVLHDYAVESPISRVHG